MTTAQAPLEVPVRGARRLLLRRRRGPAAAEGSAGPLVKLALFALCVLWMIPALGLLVTSIRDQDDASNSGWWSAIFSPWDEAFTFENYSEVLDSGGMSDAFLNSLVVAVPATVIPILIAAFAAYAFTFMRFWGRDTLFILCVGLIVVPIQVAFIPLLNLFSNFDLNGKFAAVWLVHSGFGMPLAIYTLRNYMETLPHEVIESAKVDGASHFTTFWRLIVPMSLPALAAFAIFQFLWVWNDLLVALIFLGAGTNQVVTVKLAGLVGQFGQDWHLLTAGAFISMVLPLAVFFSLQRFFVRGLTSGAVKG
jgi:alpha-glucoside transport system permease protein